MYLLNNLKVLKRVNWKYILSAFRKNAHTYCDCVVMEMCEQVGQTTTLRG